MFAETMRGWKDAARRVVWAGVGAASADDDVDDEEDFPPSTASPSSLFTVSVLWTA